MKKYILKSSIEMDYKDDELFIIDSETGFVGTGNKYAYEVLKQLQQENETDTIIKALKQKYAVSQHHRVEKSVPKIILWALEHKLIEEL